MRFKEFIAEQKEFSMMTLVRHVKDMGREGYYPVGKALDDNTAEFEAEDYEGNDMSLQIFRDDDQLNLILRKGTHAPMDISKLYSGDDPEIAKRIAAKTSRKDTADVRRYKVSLDQSLDNIVQEIDEFVGTYLSVMYPNERGDDD